MKCILVDIDGCICAYDFPRLVWDKFHVRIDATKIFAYNLADVLGVPSRQIDEMFYDQVWGKPQFNTNTLDVLSEWKSNRYGIVIFSNRIKYMGHKGLESWLVKWQIPFSYIDEGGGIYDFHIDDRPEKLCDTNSQVKLLYDQPWNKGCLNITGKLKRVLNWTEIKGIVEEGDEHKS